MTDHARACVERWREESETSTVTNNIDKEASQGKVGGVAVGTGFENKLETLRRFLLTHYADLRLHEWDPVEKIGLPAAEDAEAKKSSVVFLYGAACTCTSRNAAARSVATISCIIVSWKSTISPTSTKRLTISTSSHLRQYGTRRVR